MADLQTNVLYYGDNLEVLRKHIPDESVDLVYLDPPFNSNRNYNVLFKETTGAASDAQMEAFEDTWEWGQHAAAAYQDVMTGKRQDVARMLGAMVDGLGHNQVTAYLVMMTPRLLELHRVLRSTGSLYLHCDPSAGHYLKVLLDSIFDPRSFVNELVWKRSSAHSDSAQGSKHFGRVHDTILAYAKSVGSQIWNQAYEGHSSGYIDSHYTHVDVHTGRRYRLDNLTGPGGAAKGNPAYEVMGVTRHWRFSQARMTELIEAGRVVQPRPGAVPSYKRYLDEMPGTPLQDVWVDLAPVNSQAKERLGYPTQKPLALLERIINASSNPGDVVLDPFCGCGTAVHAAQNLGRRWIGIDITYLAIGLIRRRMLDAFPSVPIQEVGAPVDLAGAQALAEHDKYQFQWWALDRIEAQPVGGKKKGADKGIDGVIPYFAGQGQGEGYRRAIVSVKGGGVTVNMVRDLIGVLQREKEPLGVFVTLESSTQPMRTEAASAGMWHSDFWNRDFPKVQILTVEEILHGKRPDLPSAGGATGFAKAPTEQERGEQLTLG